MKLVDIHIEVNVAGINERYSEMEVVKETEKMYMVSGNWRRRLDKSQIGIKKEQMNYYCICYSAIVPIEDRDETIKRIKSLCSEDTKQMQKDITALAKVATEKL